MEWIFLSYHHLDSSAARLLRRELEELGKDTFYIYEEGASDAPFAASSNETVENRIKSELEKCKKVIFLIAKNWRMEGWIESEYEWARASRDKIIIPVLAEGRSMPKEDDLPDGCKDFAKRIGQKFEPIHEEPLKQLKLGIRELVGANDGARYIWAAPGSYIMGVSVHDLQASQNEKDPRRVEIPDGFWIGRTPVTVWQYELFLDKKGLKRRHPECKFDGKDANKELYNKPVVNVSWADATAYCEWAGGCLPAEREWEYAARAGTVSARCGCDDLSDFAWWKKNANDRTQQVGHKNPNRWGLHDVLGNVWEWCADWEVFGTEGDEVKRGDRVVRGGSFASEEDRVRVSFRLFIDPRSRRSDVGFRCLIRDVTKFLPIP